MDAPVSLVFWILSFIIIVSAFMVVSLKNIFHCALFLILCLFSVAGIYLLLNAEFLAAAQVLIYVGAVSILMIFAIMLTSQLASKRISQTNENKLVAFFICLSASRSQCPDNWKISNDRLHAPVRGGLGAASGGHDRRHCSGKKGDILMFYYLALAALLFSIGLYGVLTRRNIIGILMSLELMFNAANINFVTFNKFVITDGMTGQVFALFVIAVAAAEAVVGLAIVLLVYRNWQGIKTDYINVMKW